MSAATSALQLQPNYCCQAAGYVFFCLQFVLLCWYLHSLVSQQSQSCTLYISFQYNEVSYKSSLGQFSSHFISFCLVGGKKLVSSFQFDSPFIDTADATVWRGWRSSCFLQRFRMNLKRNVPGMTKLGTPARIKIMT